jgi:FtsH-binding integral membrane protein
MNRTDFTIARTPGAVLETNKVLKNTYMLLSMTLLFSAVMAVTSIFLAVPSGISFASLIVGSQLLHRHLGSIRHHRSARIQPGPDALHVPVAGQR